MAEIDLSALGEAIDTSWGRSSTHPNGFSVKMSISGQGQLSLVYQTVVNFATEREMLRVKLFEADQASRNIKTIIGNVKSSYKDISGKSLKMKEVVADDSVNIIGSNFFNPKRTALYRRKCVFEIG